MKNITLLLTLTITIFSCTPSEHRETEKTEKAMTETSTDTQKVASPSTENESVETENDNTFSSNTNEAETITDENKTNTAETPSKKEILFAKTEEVQKPIEDSTIQEKPLGKTADKISIHSSYNSLLSKHVSKTGTVNYADLKKEDTALKNYLESLQKINYKTLPENDQLAFLINFYNALTLDLILENYPLKSITDLPKAWDTPRVTYQGNSLTLNDIEHQLIRENFNEPRIHFACNCAAKSCPKLLNTAYEGDLLEEQLDSQTKLFLNNSLKNQLSANSIKISKIFEWYAKDFGNVTLFIRKYNPEVNRDAKISYLEYDWTLNK